MTSRVVTQPNDEEDASGVWSVTQELASRMRVPEWAARNATDLLDQVRCWAHTRLPRGSSASLAVPHALTLGEALPPPPLCLGNLNLEHMEKQQILHL